MTPTDDLLAEMHAVLDGIDGVRNAMVEENHKRDKRIRANNRAVKAAIAVAIFGLLIGFGGLRSGHDARRALNAVVVERNETRIAACVQYNAQQDVQAAAEKTQSHDLVATLTAGSTSAATIELAKKYNLTHDRLIDESHAHRDCTPAGIRAFLDATPDSSTTTVHPTPTTRP